MSDHPTAAGLTELGNALRRQGRPAEALEAYRRAAFLAPADPGARYNIASALLDLNRPGESLPFLEQAVLATPPFAPAAATMGEAMLRLGRRAEAKQWFRQALALRPDDHPARMGFAVCLLAEGDYIRGWPAFESRLNDPGVRRSLPELEGHVLMRGEPVAGRTIVLMAEQGFGDTLHFVRYAALLRAQGARVVLLVPPDLVRLLAPLGDVVRAKGEAPPPFDALCPMLSLPNVFGTELETIPAEIPYLAAPQAEIEAWRARLPSTGRRRIGLAWSGNPEHLHDGDRSIPLAALAPLLALEGCEFHALHKVIRPGDLPLPEGVADHRAALTDFAATAGLVAQMDAVVSVDTSVAHLAGGMGKALHLLLPLHADFRWLEGREDSPWYPTARLWRQTAQGGWTTPIARLAAALG